jgi:hypothetical protein
MSGHKIYCSRDIVMEWKAPIEYIKPLVHRDLKKVPLISLKLFALLFVLMILLLSLACLTKG